MTRTYTYCDHCENEITADSKWKNPLKPGTPTSKRLAAIQGVNGDFCASCLSYAVMHGEWPPLAANPKAKDQK